MRKPKNEAICATPGHFYVPGVLATIEEAAAALFVEVDDLRDYCDREAYVCGDIALIQLDGGITGFRTRGTWQFRFPVLRSASGGPEGSHAPPTGDV
ncbi:MAG: hypothetical protein ABSC94_32075 [Polyangiaceae bacterium]|jgi:hypothetical protein